MFLEGDLICKWQDIFVFFWFVLGGGDGIGKVTANVCQVYENRQMQDDELCQVY